MIDNIARARAEFIGRIDTDATIVCVECQIGYKVWHEYLKRTTLEDFPLSDELKILFKAMAGPHWKTVLKIYRIKKGLEHGE